MTAPAQDDGGPRALQVDLVDGTYELFRYHFGLPKEVRAEGSRTGATRGVVGGVLTLLERGATHVGVATDHVIESFRNDLWPGYKSSAGVPEDLLDQFPLVEEALVALGVGVWPMVDLEADDGLASAAAAAASVPQVSRVLIHTVDKDLAQCVVGDRVVQADRRKEVILDEEGVVERYGIHPESIPDWLALVGDSSDGFPGLPGWGKKSASTVLARYRHLEEIPVSAGAWDLALPPRTAATLAATLVDQLQLVLLFRDLATLRTAPPVIADVDSLRWSGPTPDFGAICERLGVPGLVPRAEDLATGR